MPKVTTAGAQTCLPHIAARLFEEPLLVHPRKLQTLINVLAPRMFAGLEITESMRVAAQDPFLSGRSAPVDPGQHSIAVISVHGTLVQRGDSLDAASGLRSYEAIREDFDEAMTRTDIDALLLDIDSGGGEANGVFDLVDYIASHRGEKPIYAFANEHAYSAAYAIACAADKIFLPRIGGMGSIGVVAVHLDQSGFDEKNGLQYTPVYAGARKMDGWPHAALSDEAQERMQARVDAVYDVFTETVARYRGISQKDVIATEADCFDGSAAVKAGLADGIASFDAVVETIMSDLESRALNPVSGPTARESNSGQPGETPTKKEKGENTMSLKNLVMGKNRRAVQTQAPDDENPANPADEKEADKKPGAEEKDKPSEDLNDPENPDDEEGDDFIDDEEEDLPGDDEGDDPPPLETRKNPHSEALEIGAICKLYGKPELADKYLKKGYSAAQVRKHLLAKRNSELKASSQKSVISNRQSARSHSGSGGVVAAVKQKLGMKE